MTAAASERPDTAGVIAPPPLIFLVALALGILIDAFLPSPDVGGAVATTFGVALAIAGALLAFSFLRAFRDAGTAVDPYRPSERLVTTGPYRLSRNPGYLGMALAYAGIAILIPAPWAYLTLAIALVLVDRGVVVREEAYLERRFGDAYRAYKARTRRWL